MDENLVPVSVCFLSDLNGDTTWPLDERDVCALNSPLSFLIMSGTLGEDSTVCFCVN